MTSTGVPLKQVGRYTIFDQIGAGGMATVHLARFSAPGGFSRVVAVKHLLPHLSLDAEFKALIVEEAQTASRVRHRNVVPTLDVVVEEGDVYIVMEYVPGEALGFLRRAAKEARRDIPATICGAILVGVLQGLHAAHEARTPSGQFLDLVHRDVSPPNILVGSDGVPVVLDFGIARTLHGQGETRSGRVKGKSSYMAPEQIRGEPVTRAVDIFAATVVLWELLTGRRLFFGATEQERMRKVLEGAEAMPPSLLVPHLPKGLDEVVLKGLRQNPRHRFRTALEMAEAIEKVVLPASPKAVGRWVEQTAGQSLRQRGELLKQVEISDLAIPPRPIDVGRGVGASQASYAPLALPTRPTALRRSRSAVIEGLAVGGVTAAILLMVIRYGRPGESGHPEPSTTTSRAAAHVDPAPVVVPTRAAAPIGRLPAAVTSRRDVERQLLEDPAAAVPPGSLVRPLPAPLALGAPVMVPIPATAPLPVAVPGPSGPPASSYEIVAAVAETAPPKPVPSRVPRGAATRGPKSPGRPHPAKDTKRRPRASATAITAQPRTAPRPTPVPPRSERRNPNIRDE